MSKVPEANSVAARLPLLANIGRIRKIRSNVLKNAYDTDAKNPPSQLPSQSSRSVSARVTLLQSGRTYSPRTHLSSEDRWKFQNALYQLSSSVGAVAI